jgi:hypothetical protein
MEEYIYTDSKGNQFQLHQFQNSHLVNALVKKAKLTMTDGATEEELKEAFVAVDAIKAEVLRRMPRNEGEI